MFGGLSVVAALVAGMRPDHWLSPALAGVAGGLVLDRLWSYGATYLRATAELWRLALYELINAVLQIVLVVALAYVWGLEGALLGFVLATAAVILLLRGRVPMRPALSLSRLRSLLHTGFPVGLTLVLVTGLASIDRIAVATFGGRRSARLLRVCGRGLESSGRSWPSCSVRRSFLKCIATPRRGASCRRPKPTCAGP